MKRKRLKFEKWFEYYFNNTNLNKKNRNKK